MKKHLTLLLLAGSLAATAQVHFPTTNAVWTERRGNGEAPPSYSVIGMKTDVISIGSYTYTKLYRSTDAVLSASEYIGGLREDGMQRVFYYDAATSQEHKLYDFSLSVGDTIFTPSGQAEGIVHNIDVLVIGSVNHKRINFRHLSGTATWTGGSWVEGIGNTSVGGLLGSVMAQPTCDCGYKTICFTDAGVQKYHNGLYAALDCDDVLTTTNVNPGPTAISNTTVTVFPNPMTGTSHLQVTGNQQYTRLAIYDMLGKMIQRADVNGVSDVTLIRNDYAPGMYMYRLHDASGNSVSGKFVVE